MIRQIVLDTETTGLETQQGHRIIEVGALELVNRRLTGNRFHQYINPKREIDEAAIEVHGITNEYLVDKPEFTEVAQDLREFLSGAELIIHNAPFDVGFLNHEFNLCGIGADIIDDECEVLDTLVMARKLHPGQKNNLDALCRRYVVDNSQRTLHGALLDAEILADVYLAMTGGQTTLLEGSATLGAHDTEVVDVDIELAPITKTRVVQADTSDVKAHDQWMSLLTESGRNIWLER